MDIKLFDSELKVMCVLWNEGGTCPEACGEGCVAGRGRDMMQL
jgi:hypothetical protein